MNLVVPKKLVAGDKVACVSLSWGGAGDDDLRWRYELGKKRLVEEFGLVVVEMEHTLKGTDYLYNHPKKRAEDLMNAFLDKSIKAIFSTIGGDDTIRLLPYIDFDVIKENPKIFLGYSDTTVNHFMCLKSGLRSYYGPAILSEFAENISMSPYTKDYVKKALFSNEVLGEITASDEWVSEHLRWEEKNKNQRRKTSPNQGPMLLQGRGIARGPLIGGCMDVLEMIKGTSLWPEKEMFDGAILFFETSEETPSPDFIKYWLRNYGAMGMFDQINGIIIGKPFDEKYIDEYKETFVQVVSDEYQHPELPILFNLNFGHTAPMFVIPYGAIGTINCERVTFSIDEPAVK